MIKLDATYSAYVDTTDSKYPQGKAIDASSDEGYDGTPYKADWMNDIIGSRQALIKASGVSVSGNPDNANVSDVLNAVQKLIKNDVDDEAELRRTAIENEETARDSAISTAIGNLGNAKLKDVDEAITNVSSTNLPTTKAVTDYIVSASDIARTEILHCYIREKSWWFLELDEENNLSLIYDETINLSPPTIELNYEHDKLVIKHEYPYDLDIRYEDKKMTMTLL